VCTLCSESSCFVFLSLQTGCAERGGGDSSTDSIIKGKKIKESSIHTSTYADKLHISLGCLFPISFIFCLARANRGNSAKGLYAFFSSVFVSEAVLCLYTCLIQYYNVGVIREKTTDREPALFGVLFSLV
jgi:hypothetical protein